MTQVGRVNEALSKLLRRRDFYLLLEWAQPSYYKRTDIDGLFLDSFLRKLSGEFDPTGITGVPRYDRLFNFTPV
ncbi:MAG: hypothetical protein ACKPKO_16555, partial [Candidatus Fonsibacter sp.]